MDNTALIARLLRRLKVERNGAVAEVMEQRGIVYPLSYGVSIPTIREIAREYGPNHSLALLLYKQQVRELKLAALFIEDPARVTTKQVREWSRDFTHPEIVELTIMYLFSRSEVAASMVGEWLSSENVFLRYAGVMMLMRTAGGPLCREEQVGQLLQEVDAMLMGHEPEPLIIRGTVNALCHCAAISDALRAEVRRYADGYAISERPGLCEIASELSRLISSERDYF